jgi:AraC family transcriptional regulator
MQARSITASYAQRVARVSDYIHDNLDADLSLDRLASIACMSRFHWHRVYQAMQGETVAETVRRLRLCRAAEWLANSSYPVADIARRSGYGSVDAFNRIFRDHYGQTPAAFRENGSHARFKRANAESDARGFPVVVERLPALRCVGLAHHGSYMTIGKTMVRLAAALAGQGVDGRPRMLAMFLDDPDLVPEDRLRAMIMTPTVRGIAIEPPCEEIVLGEGTYATLRYVGPYADMLDAYRWLFGVWLPRSGLETSAAQMIHDYLDDPAETSPADLRTNICLQVALPSAAATPADGRS